MEPSREFYDIEIGGLEPLGVGHTGYMESKFRGTYDETRGQERADIAGKL